jgi:hypothetical protein
MSPEIDQQAETLAAGFTLERMFRKGTSVRAVFDRALKRQQAYVSYDVKAVYPNMTFGTM